MTSMQANVLIGLAVCGVVALIILMLRSGPQSVAAQIEQAIGRLGQAVQHYTEVNAVVALVGEFERDPDLLNNVAGYAQEVVAATLLLRVNALGNNIKVIQRQLDVALTHKGTDDPGANANVLRLETMLDNLRDQLDTANCAVQQLTGLRAV